MKQLDRKSDILMEMSCFINTIYCVLKVIIINREENGEQEQKKGVGDC